MLTPAFEISQDNNKLIINIHAPYTKISETEVYFHENEFKFYSKPYFLRLNLPGEVIENGSEKASYDSDTGTFIIHAPKLNPGERFEGLDLITKLLAPSKKVVSYSGVEVIGSGNDGNSHEILKDFDEFNWELDQTPYIPEEDVTIQNAKYGFANLYSGVVSRLQDELYEVLDVRNPDKKSFLERREERLKVEAEQFNDDYYLGDLYEDEEIQKLLLFQPSWTALYNKYVESPTLCVDDLVTFSEEEREQMRKLPSKEYHLDTFILHKVLFGLVDILFAFAYNARTTEEEHTVESVWTLRKLSSALSWFESHSNLEAAIISTVRRSLCYPLYRHWGLSSAVLVDVQHILSLGTKYVTKCFLSIRSLMNKTDPHYILNDLYITDYCVWLQTIKSETFQSLAQAVKKVKVSKESMNLDLLELEMGAKLALKEEEENSQNSDSDDLSSTSSCSSLSSADRLCAGIDRMTITNSDARDSYNESASESDVSDDSTSTDSDDLSSSIDEYSSDTSDDDSTDSSVDNLLLRKEKCPERKR